MENTNGFAISPGIEIVGLAPTDDPLKGLHGPISEDLMERASQVITTQTPRVRDGFRAMVFGRLQDAVTQEQLAKLRLDEAGANTVAAEEKAAGHAGGSIVKGVLALLCFPACFVAEVTFNLAVLPWLLNVPRDSVLGIALAVAPAAAPIILDVLFKHLFDVEDPWAGTRSALFSAFGQRARRAFSVLFIVALAAANLAAIWLLADCRGVTSKLIGQDTAIALTAAEEGQIQIAIQALSIVLCVNGAVFYLLGLHELRGWAGRRALRRSARALRETLEGLRRAHSQACASLAVCQAAWQCVEADAQAAAQDFEARQQLRLAQLAPRTAQQRALAMLEAGPKPGVRYAWPNVRVSND